MRWSSEMEMEETPWVTITFLITLVVATFGYRFFGPEQPHLEEQPKETTVCLAQQSRPSVIEIIFLDRAARRREV